MTVVPAGRETEGPSAAELGAILAEGVAGGVTTDPYMLHLYSRDASMYAIEPLAVAFPRDAGDVEAVVLRARELQIPLIARGAGTSLAGQTVGRGIVLDFSRHMRSIVALDPEERVARVQPGVVQDELNAAAAPHGLMFGADTSTSNRATLGGMIGNNSSGTNSLRFGTTVDHVRGLRVVLADGAPAAFGSLSGDPSSSAGAGRLAAIRSGLPELARRHRAVIEKSFPRYWRHSGGYRLPELLRPAIDLPNLASFLVGSEGTLALVTEAEVALVERPRARAMAVGHFRTVTEALAATADALECNAVAIELMDSAILNLARQRHEYSSLSSFVEGSPGALLFVTFIADSEAEAVDAMERLAATWQRHGHGYHTLRARSPEAQDAVMKVRRSSLGLLMASSTGTRRPLAFVEDTAVPPDLLESYVARFSQILAAHGLKTGYYGHCAVGCLHIRPFVDLREPKQEAAMAAVASEILELVIEFGGVNSSEHGDGLARSPFNERFFGPELYAVMRDVKELFDPERLLNPGKIVDAASLTDQLRDRDLPPAAPLATKLDFGPEGMRGAADRCMNIGACRKRDSGVMCPSYMATGQEEHSTRGRANALVRALSSPGDLRRLGDRRLYEILDLCLECKACASECPLSVDMAALKSEFLYHYQAVHGIPLRSRVFGSARTLGRIGCATAPLLNWVNDSPLFRRSIDRWLGITAERPLPRFERESLIKWHSRRRQRTVGSTAGDVVFLADSFSTFSEPRIGRVAIELLEGAAWNVHLESRGCCGRASVSKGLLDQARVGAARLVERLAPFARRGVPIVGCEPSCLFMLRDDVPKLLPKSEEAEAVAAQVRPLADLLTEAIRDGRLVLDASAFAGKTLLYHPHCHERAAGASGATLELLRTIPGAIVSELDAGCCGMAGSFGFESEHYRLSMEIGELRLFPAVRAADPDATVTATGVSCRQQIAHGTDRRAVHPVELLRSLARLG